MVDLSTNQHSFQTAEALSAVFDSLDRHFGDWRQIEVVGARGVGKTYFCAAYAKRSGCAIANRALSNRLIRPQMTFAEHFGRLFLPRRKRTGIRTGAVRRLTLSLAPDERDFLLRLLDVLQAPLEQDLGPERYAALEYCARETPAAVVRAAYLHRKDIKALLDEGVLKLLLGFLRWYPGELPDAVIDEVRACLDMYPGERCALFLDAPAHIVNARRTARGDPPGSEASHEGSFRLLCSLCEQTGWRVLRVDAWSDG